MGEFITKVHSTIGEIPQEDWDACAGVDNPFTSYAFLSALEKSGSATTNSGWVGQHLSVWDKGKMVAALPLYLKNHSQGEYVFDHSWANAYEAAGGKYYPKLQSSIPFTPAKASKILVHPEANQLALKSHLVEALKSVTLEMEVSSLHLTFLTKDEADTLEKNDFLIRCDQQFHWENNEYDNFDDFLMSLSSRKRKTINRERREVLESEIKIEVLTGASILELHWDYFFEFYQDTGTRKWGQPYLSRQFFSEINQSMPNKIVLMMAKWDGYYVAGALNFLGVDTLFGRNWGTNEHHPFLHFELCYYQAIDFAIQHKLKWVEAGAQGEHKLSRGYLPRKTYSAHYIPNSSFKGAVANYLKYERKSIDHAIDYLYQFSPFKKT